MSDNLFNISVSNAIDEVLDQYDQMKVEDYVSQAERYRLLRYQRIDDLNERMQDILRRNSELFYDERRVQFGISSQDSAFALSNARLSPSEEAAITQYNTLLSARNRIVSSTRSLRATSPNLVQPVGLINASQLNFPLLDSLVREELIINGIDLEPAIGVLQTGADTLLHHSPGADTVALRRTAFKYTFQPNGIVSDGGLYLLLAFPPSPIILSSDANLYTLLSIGMILLISFLFSFSLRTIWAQRRLDEMKTDFINNMTHEIKTPIATIGLACEMLSDDTVTSNPSQRSNFIRIISDENRRMRVLIDTLLQSAKMAGKRFSLNLTSVDLDALVEASVQSFRLAVENRNGTLDFHPSPTPAPGILYADELHLSNMVYNLIDNAVKYSNDAPLIRVSTRYENGMAVLEVSDHGIGIAREDQEHIFEKFYRVSTGDVHNVKGFGIGLNYVAQVVNLHGGHIELDSQPGVGSTFTVRLPLSE